MTTMRSTQRHGRHVLEGGRRPSLRRIGRLRFTPGRIAAAAAAILLGVFAAAGTAAGSFAYLNATAQTTAGSTISAGTSALTIQSGAGVPSASVTLPATVWNRMLPGDIVGQTVTVTNTGDAPLAVSARLSGTSAWEFRVNVGACPATQIPGAALTTTSSATGALPAGASATLCIQTTLPTGAANSAQGTTPVLQLLLDGVQTA
jgi:hypothetical protein